MRAKVCRGKHSWKLIRFPPSARMFADILALCCGATAMPLCGLHGDQTCQESDTQLLGQSWATTLELPEVLQLDPGFESHE